MFGDILDHIIQIYNKTTVKMYNRLQMALVSNTRKTIHRTVSFYSQEKHFENGHSEILELIIIEQHFENGHSEILALIIMGLRVEIQFEQSMYVALCLQKLSLSETSPIDRASGQSLVVSFTKRQSKQFQAFL